MNKTEEIEQMKKMRVLFIGFILLVPIGIALEVTDIAYDFAPIIVVIGMVLGLLCAFTKCPCCSKFSGFFAYYIIMGVVPIGFCVHCKKSYIGAKGCNTDS